MSAFDHVTVLLSFVYALALTHVLSRIGVLAMARERVKFSGLAALAMLNALALIYANWILLWDFHAMASWDLASVSGQFVFAVAQYFLCIFATPESDGETDLEAFFWRQRRLYYGTLLAVLVLSLVTNATLLETTDMGRFARENAASLPLFVPILAALFFSQRWVQWLSGLAILTSTIGFTIAFAGVIK